MHNECRLHSDPRENVASGGVEKVVLQRGGGKSIIPVQSAKRKQTSDPRSDLVINDGKQLVALPAPEQFAVHEQANGQGTKSVVPDAIFSSATPP